MKIVTKYNFGDRVFIISKGSYSKFINCETCLGEGKITITPSNKIITCVTCHGMKGFKKYYYEKWGLYNPSSGVVGKIDIDYYPHDQTEYKSKLRYMLDSTGIGSGTLFDEENLFPSLEEAQNICDIRNADYVETEVNHYN